MAVQFNSMYDVVNNVGSMGQIQVGKFPLFSKSELSSNILDYPGIMRLPLLLTFVEEHQTKLLPRWRTQHNRASFDYIEMVFFSPLFSHVGHR